MLKRHGDSRRLATLLAIAVYLTTRAVDDALDLLEVLIATKLLAEGVAPPHGIRSAAGRSAVKSSR